MRDLLLPPIILLLTGTLTAQNSLSFYHLGNTTYQNSNFNPSWIPEGDRLFIGLPVISGVHLHANNKLSYNELFTKNDADGSVLLDIGKTLGNLQNQNLTSGHVGVSLLHIGFRLKNGAFISLFANERGEADALYSEEIVDYLWRGNSHYLNEEVQVSNVGVKATWFREIGLGYAVSPAENLDIGVRVKYLLGFADISAPQNFKATLNSDGGSFAISGDWQNAELRTSGLDIVENELGENTTYFIQNKNSGFGIDLGVTFDISDYHTVAGSVTDIGFISWKEDVKNYRVNDTTFTYSGIDLGQDIDNLRDILIDSLFDRFDYIENNDSYTSWLPVRATGSYIFHAYPRTDFYATISSRFIQRQVKMLYGGGVTSRFGRSLTLSGSITKLPQQFLNLGGALAVKGGFVQFYIAADQIINFSAPDAKAFDFRFGFNFIFGERKDGNKKVSISDPKGIDTTSFLDKKVKTKRRKGIYSIIKKQKKPKKRKKK